mmetsp:Transcript_21/g.58  ORF Transcript_21/g.58 Transcript_21/m.58 type:complete len:201 (-) Transcript_21:2964-3566(-)
MSFVKSLLRSTLFWLFSSSFLSCVLDRSTVFRFGVNSKSSVEYGSRGVGDVALAVSFPSGRYPFRLCKRRILLSRARLERLVLHRLLSSSITVLRVGERELEARRCRILLRLTPRPTDFDRICLGPVSPTLPTDPSESDIVEWVHPVSDVSSEMSNALSSVDVFLYAKIEFFQFSLSVGGGFESDSFHGFDGGDPVPVEA